MRGNPIATAVGRYSLAGGTLLNVIIAPELALLDFRIRPTAWSLKRLRSRGIARGVCAREEQLGFLGFFRRQAPIRDLAGLADFIDANSAFLAQKGIYEYSRARAGHYAKVLFQEQLFQEAVEKSRWTAFPLALAMVGELAEGVLSRHTADRRRQLEALQELVLSVFDRYPVPAALGHEAWRTERAELVRRLQLIGMHPPKRSFDICEPWAKTYFDLMPIHEKLRGRDFPTTRNYLRVTLCNIHDELTKRMDAPALAGMLSTNP
jgi:hypothetical protein